MTLDRPVVVALGTVDPALVSGVPVRSLRLSPIRPIRTPPTPLVRSSVPTPSSIRHFLRAQRLRVLARTGVGVDHVDLQAATARGIPVVITPGSGSRAVAEGVFALALHLLKRLGRSTDLVRHGQWADRGQLSMGGDLDGATIGIIGYGRIGRRVGDLAEAFGMHLMAYDPFSAPPPEIAAAGGSRICT